MTQTITVAELLSDAGRDVRAAWDAANGDAYTDEGWRIIVITDRNDGTYAALDTWGEWHILLGTDKLTIHWQEGFSPPVMRTPLALAEAALRSFLSWKEFFPNDILSGDGDIQMSAQVSTTGEPFKQAADALAVIEAARKGE